MTLQPRDALTEAEREEGLAYVLRDGLASQAMATLTGGIFLVAFALELGASNFLIGILAAIPPLAQLLQVPSVALVNWLRNRRLISVVASGVSRLTWLLVALLPVIGAAAGRRGLIVLLFFASALGAVSTCGWNSWMRDLVPEDRLGSFFSRRMSLSIGLGVILSLAAAFFVDWWSRSGPLGAVWAYSLLFVLGSGAGLTGVFFLSRIPEPKMTPMTGGFFTALRKPFRDENFRNLLVFLGSWSFAVNLAAPFFTVYMLRRLELDLSWVIGLTVLSQVTHFGFVRIWGAVADQYSNKSVLGVCAPLFVMAIGAWTFTTLPDPYVLTIPLLVVLHVVMGLSMAGVSLAAGNITLKLAPSADATQYLAASTLVNSLAAGIAPILGGSLADYFAGRSLEWILRWQSPTQDLAFYTLNLQQWDFFFVGAALIGVYSLHRLVPVQEVGTVENEKVWNLVSSLTRRRMSNFSPVGGLRQAITFPLGLLSALPQWGGEGDDAH